MAEFTRNLWAPWRMQYIETLAGRDPGGCFLCRYCQSPADDQPNHVLWRSDRTLVVLNRFPYSSGHLLVTPTAHQARLEAVSDDVRLEMLQRLCQAQRVLEIALKAQGFNLGMNVGHCAGAGLPDHLHWHVVPRWSGDTNFMAVLDDIKVMPEALDQVYAKLRATAAQLGW
jgi:ATP adenylyltransferase